MFCTTEKNNKNNKIGLHTKSIYFFLTQAKTNIVVSCYQ